MQPLTTDLNYIMNYSQEKLIAKKFGNKSLMNRKVQTKKRNLVFLYLQK